ncbi:MAG: TRAP-type C4-dicarboxylate transport system, substrate-binding protein [Myxococcales bacterium]|nr:TRAP-type C4-dicarboxylate transport system, substrate-binding protein [Myxococcales bacterium]
MPVRLLVALLLFASVAHADPTPLRFATVAPDGTAWARLFRAMARDLERDSNGAVTSKWYFGGIAGNELQMLDRLRKNQLDGVMSGGILCMRLSPSMRALRLLGLFQSRDEASYVLGRLRPTIDAEFAAAGFHNMGEAGLGSDMAFSRQPITSLAELRRTRLWFWDLDETLRVQLRALGMAAIGLPVEESAHAFEDRRTDGFIAVPTAALAYQWSAQTTYLSELRLGYLPGCMVMSNHAWDSLSVEARSTLTEAAGKFAARLEELGRTQDAALLSTLFARQGIKQTPVSAGFAGEFFEAAREAREATRDKLIPSQLIDRVTGWIADYRAEYPRGATSTPQHPTPPAR